MSDGTSQRAKEGNAAPAAARLDPRRNVFRSDLAAESLYGKVSVPRYVRGSTAQVSRPATPVFREPDASSSIDTEALFGEIVTVYDERAGWAWVQLACDGYVGYVPASTLKRPADEPTHRVRALGTFIYPAPNIKAPPLMHLSMNARLCVSESDEQFCALKHGGFVVARHVAEQGRHERDFVEIAERFVGTPYLWGGRSRIGLDCSGLVQVALAAAGFRVPRDTDMQQAEIGSYVDIPEGLEGLQRGDLVFWQGHVGILVDSVMLVHANAHHMMVTTETLPEAAGRVAKSNGNIIAIKRLRGLCA